METKHWIVNQSFLQNKKAIEEAADLIRRGEVVAFPTETVYGLGGQVKMDSAVQKIFEAKGRPSDNPLIVHIADKENIHTLAAFIPAYAFSLIEAFWPGPLTVIVPKKEGVLSELVTAGLDTVAVRMPSHPAALALIQEAGVPIAAPSANRSGRPSPTTAAHVLKDLNGRIAGVVDGGETGVGLESTVVDCTGAFPVVLRPGGITVADIERIAGKSTTKATFSNNQTAPKAPGMKYTHYAPDAPLYLMDGSPDAIQQQVDVWRSKGQKVGVLATEESAPLYRAEAVLSCGRRSDLTTVARELYKTLRAFNEAPVDVIVSETFPEEGVGAAIMNRLEKAAGDKRIEKTKPDQPN